MNFFLENPQKQVGLRELAKILRISPSTTKQYIDSFTKEELVIDKNIRNNKIVVLNNKNLIVKELKRLYILDKFKQLNIEKIIDNPFYLYGSFSTGEYHKDSDIDLFVIKRKEYDKDALRRIGLKLGHEVKAIDVMFYDLLKYKQKHKEFMSEVKIGFFFGEEINEL